MTSSFGKLAHDLANDGETADARIENADRRRATTCQNATDAVTAAPRSRGATATFALKSQRFAATYASHRRDDVIEDHGGDPVLVVRVPRGNARDEAILRERARRRHSRYGSIVNDEAMLSRLAAFASRRSWAACRAMPSENISIVAKTIAAVGRLSLACAAPGITSDRIIARRGAIGGRFRVSASVSAMRARRNVARILRARVVRARPAVELRRARRGHARAEKRDARTSSAGNGDDRVDLYEAAARQRRYLNRGARGTRISEPAAVDFVHDRKRGHVVEIHRRLDDVLPSRPGSLRALR